MTHECARDTTWAPAWPGAGRIARFAGAGGSPGEAGRWLPTPERAFRCCCVPRPGGAFRSDETAEAGRVHPATYVPTRGPTRISLTHTQSPRGRRAAGCCAPRHPHAAVCASRRRCRARKRSGGKAMRDSVPTHHRSGTGPLLPVACVRHSRSFSYLRGVCFLTSVPSHPSSSNVSHRTKYTLLIKIHYIIHPNSEDESIKSN
jgi:hypothetical protein